MTRRPIRRFVVPTTLLLVASCSASIRGPDGPPDDGVTAPPVGETPAPKPDGTPPPPASTGGMSTNPTPPAAMPTANAPAGKAGILGCPTIDPPAYGQASVATLSDPFRSNCAVCHGGVGQGLGRYPAIPGKLTRDEFIAKVRKGAGNMPAFGSEFVSDAQLADDFASLQKLAGQTGGAAASAQGPSTWTDARVEELFRTGLAMWRKAGSVDGQACTNCHSADGVELAVIGFSDDSILRRGQQHLSAADALVVRDFIHAQRRRLGIGRPCSPDWRPFQPGGKVLPGGSPAEQDASFLTELQSRKLLVATGKVVTLDDAKRAFAELQAVDLRQLPMGIPLPRWSEDKFNGPEHRDINDYMAPVPTAPNKPAEYFAIEDAYLADPTDARLYGLLDQNRKNMNDLGYVAKNTVPRAGGNCPGYPDSTSWLMTRVAMPKRLSVLVAAHLFRQELAQPGSFFARSAAPFPEATAPVNPAFTLGSFAIEPPCYDNVNYPNWIKSFPSSFRDEFPQSDLDRGTIENATDRITHEWMTLGQIIDPTLMATDGMQDNKIHYWAFRNFKQKDVHLPFMYVHRIASQTKYWESMRGTPKFPKTSGPFNVAHQDWLHPLLATVNQESAGLQSAVAPDDKEMPSFAVNQFKGNLIRTMMLLSRDLLKRGMALQTDQNYDHCLAVTCQTEHMVKFVESLHTGAATAAGKTAWVDKGFDLALFDVDTRALIGEVVTLMKAAPKR